MPAALTSTIPIVTLMLRKAAAQFAQLPRALKLVWHAAPAWTAAWGVLLLLQGLLPVATVYLVRNLVNQLVVAFRARGDLGALRPAMVSAALIAVVLLLMELLKSISNWVRTAQSGLVQDYITALVHRSEERRVGKE